jgi:sirohydrochlorin cobaltochelatase
VVLVGHGSPSPAGEGAYLAFEKLLRSSFPNQNVFLGVVEGKPDKDAALNAVNQSGAAGVVFMPLLVVAGEHMQKDILGDDPESWKSRLLAVKPYRLEASPRGLGYNDDVVQLYLDHLKEALERLAK